MNAGPSAPSPPREAESNLGRVVMNDLRKGRLSRKFLNEFREIYFFYLDEERRSRLARMGRFRRAVSLLGWILKSLLMKLSPARRLLLLLALVLSVIGPFHYAIESFQIHTDLRPWGSLVLLFILMLELKDKLLARDEIEIARQVQIALLPRRHPDVPGWLVWSHSRPANDVGGDLVDYLELDGFRHGVVLGDVAGKGLGAALLTAKLQATLRALLPAAASLDDLGSIVNAIFHRDGLENRYATLFFAELEHDSGHLRFLNAGHNPPYVIRQAGMERLHASSYPLGMLPSAVYEEGVVDLLPGDMLFAYSDGLTEAQNDRGDEFGVERLEQLLPSLRDLAPEVAGDRVMLAIDRFAGDCRPGDDLSMVVIVRR